MRINEGKIRPNEERTKTKESMLSVWEQWDTGSFFGVLWPIYLKLSSMYLWGEAWGQIFKPTGCSRIIITWKVSSKKQLSPEGYQGDGWTRNTTLIMQSSPTITRKKYKKTTVKNLKFILHKLYENEFFKISL